jgi:tRNA 2-(methylsulfanyl)-N6-isopentenyladenosine37 hydroxylase
MSEAALLLAPTPPGWYEEAARRWPELLLDHASCEKKAASTALSLLFAYAEDLQLGRELARLAREELRHYEQVLAHMAELGVRYERRTPGRYAAGLRRGIAHAEPERRLDLLLCGAFIEARSAERFATLKTRLPAPLAGLYGALEAAEARHQGLYLAAAERHARASGLDFEAHLRPIALREATLATDADPDFRFHSGPPA